MKNTIALVALVLTFSMNTQAQKNNSRKKGGNLTTEQKTTLAVKKMTLSLDLTESQQNQIRPLLAKKITDRSKMKEIRENREADSKIDHFKAQNERLDKMIAFKKEMKRILNADQYEKFEKIAKKKMHKKKKHPKRKGGPNKK